MHANDEITHCLPQHDFWRHREDCDYLVSRGKILRMGDGQKIFEGSGKKLEAKIAWLRKRSKHVRPMRVKEIA